MNKTVVINIVGLTQRLIGEHTPFISEWSKKAAITPIKPVLPAVTCSAQATYLTGKWPSQHGIVGNGWYFEEEYEVKFWRQSNKLIQSDKIWDVLKKENPNFTCANLFWWYNMYSTADYSVTPRPNYLADGRKIPDIYSHPSSLRDQLQEELGTFPLFHFWGPKTSIKSSQWIANSAIKTDQLKNPTLTLIYLPHLDYNIQRHGIDFSKISKDLNEIDAVAKQLIQYYEGQNTKVILVSEYGITNVNHPIHLNRILRKEGLLAIREERGLELLDAGASDAFAVADHQLAHIYVKDKSKISVIKNKIATIKGVEQVLTGVEIKQNNLSHSRAGDIVVVANKDSWFTYYYWLDDKKAPDFARMVDIHKKPGYDPAEMLINPKIKLPISKIVWKLLKKKLGFRTLMDVIPIDATLIKGSHGRIPEDMEDYPVLISNSKFSLNSTSGIEATEVYHIIKKQILDTSF